MACKTGKIVRTKHEMVIGVMQERLHVFPCGHEGELCKACLSKIARAEWEASQPKRYDISTRQGATGAYEEQKKRYAAMQAKTAKERREYLTAAGFVRLSMDKIDTGVRINWKLPEGTMVVNQTRALLIALWREMEKAGTVYRGRK